MSEPYQSGRTGTGPGSSGCIGFGWTWLPDFGFGSETGYLHVKKTGSGYGNGFGLPKVVPMPRSSLETTSGWKEFCMLMDIGLRKRVVSFHKEKCLQHDSEDPVVVKVAIPAVTW